MDANKFLRMCQRASRHTGGVTNLAAAWEEDTLVRWRGVRYIPHGYMMTFRGDGSPVYTAYLLSVRGNAAVRAPLSEVEG